ncbi:hypothetical protein [Porphyromonas sp.]
MERMSPLYREIVLTNQKALNIRNLLCHGIMPLNIWGLVLLVDYFTYW